MQEATAPAGTTTPAFGAGYSSPGWKRAQATGYRGSHRRPRNAVIEGDGRLVATADPKAGGDWSSAATASSTRSSATAPSRAVEGNKLTVDFEKAGEKKVIDSFVEKT